MADEEGARKEARSWAASPIWMVLFIIAALFLPANTYFGRPLSKLDKVKDDFDRITDSFIVI